MNKQRILDEIKRIALAQGGKPPGRDRFERETGIRESDWLPRYWLRWGDAVQEAGFTPNKMQVRLDEDVVLEKYMAFARELGRLPLFAELRLKAKTDPSFPSHGALYRLGGKAGIVAAAAQLAQKRHEFQDVVPLLRTTTPSRVKPEAGVTLRKVVVGVVYLMKSGRHYKIGRTNSIGRREWELGIKIPIPPKTLHYIETDDPVGVEAYWHRRFAEKRGEGEWFTLSPEDIAAFKRWKRIA